MKLHELRLADIKAEGERTAKRHGHVLYPWVDKSTNPNISVPDASMAQCRICGRSIFLVAPSRIFGEVTKKRCKELKA